MPRPQSLKIESASLLRDLRSRLALRMPEYAEGNPDPTDPGWMLLEEAAWLVEVLSDQLDRYPYSVVQQVIHLIGGTLLPARPAVGFVVGRTESAAILNASDAHRTRLFAPQTEGADVVEFVLAEQQIPLQPAQLSSLSLWKQAELSRVVPSTFPPAGSLLHHTLWQGKQVRCSRFSDEAIAFHLVSNNVKATLDEVSKAIVLLDARKLGWLSLKAEQTGPDGIRIDAVIDLARPFATSCPDGFTSGDDVVAEWASLDDSTWVPPVVVQEHPLLPRTLHGTRPFPSDEEGHCFIPDVPENFPVDQLLRRVAAPIPQAVIENIWTTLTHLNTRLKPLRAKIVRSLRGDSPDEPQWLEAALQSGTWSSITGQGSKYLLHISHLQAKVPSLRVGWITSSRQTAPIHAEFFAITKDGRLLPAPLKMKGLWTLPGQIDRDGGLAVQTQVVEVQLFDDIAEIVASFSGEPLGYVLNPMMVINAPVIDDGRLVPIRRMVPEPIHLLHQDLVTEDVINQLLQQPIPEAAARRLSRLRTAHFSIEHNAPIDQWTGVHIDPSTGIATFNAPDLNGEVRSLRPGQAVQVDWYRRTDGRLGNLQPGTLLHSEQPPNTGAAIVQIANPVSTVFGEDREDPTDAVDRIFGPPGATPVLPADFERVFRQALGPSSKDWTVRVWTYAERSLMSTQLWPIPSGNSPANASTLRIQKALVDASPETLFVVIGPTDRLIGESEFAAATATIQRKLLFLRRRMPAIRQAIVGRIWPLKLTQLNQSPLQLPSHDTFDMLGELVDPSGHRAAVPPNTLLLNAVVTELVTEEDWA